MRQPSIPVSDNAGRPGNRRNVMPNDEVLAEAPGSASSLAGKTVHSEARNTSSAESQSFSVIFVDIADIQISRLPTKQTIHGRGILSTILAAIRPHGLALQLRF